MGVSTALEALKRSSDTNQLTITTTELAGNQTHDINIGEKSDKIDSVSFKPSDVTPAKEGILFIVRPIVESGSTDTTVSLYESADRDAIDEYLRITNVSVNDGASTYQPGSGNGVQFDNQNDKEKFYLRLEENSNNNSVYSLRMRWIDLKRLR